MRRHARRLAAFALLTILELAMVRQVNAAAMAIADSSEGCVLHVYKDPAGVVTGGWGHVGPDLPPLGTPITQEQADGWRAGDMARAAAFVEAHVKVPLTDNQFSALAEFTYNSGVGAFLSSKLLRKLNQGNYAAVPGQLALWVNGRNPKTGKKEPLPGLVARRAAEAHLFVTPDTHTVIVTPVVSTDSVHVATASAPSICTPAPVPQPPSLIERIRAWLSGADRIPTPTGVTP